MLDGLQIKVKVYDGNLRYKNFWVWGTTGLGKSRWAAGQESLQKTYKKPFNKWWDGFDLGTCTLVIIDDWPCYPNGQVLAYHLKIWGDRYSFVAEVKNSGLMLAPGEFRLIVTSNFSLEDVFQNPEDRAAIRRRFCVIEMTKENVGLIMGAKIGDIQLTDEADRQEANPIVEVVEDFDR
jgi:hypothetical protein